MNKEQINTTDEARKYLQDKVIPHFGDTTFADYVNSKLAGDFAFHLARHIAGLCSLVPAQLEKAPDPAGFQVRNSYSKNEWTGCHGFATKAHRLNTK